MVCGGAGGAPRFEKTAQYREELDPLAPIFAEEYLQTCDDSVWTPVCNLALGYRQYADAHGWAADKQWSETYLGKLLAAQHTRKRRQVQTALGAQRLVGYHGVALGRKTLVSAASSWVVDEDGRVEAWQGNPAI